MWGEDMRLSVGGIGCYCSRCFALYRCSLHVMIIVYASVLPCSPCMLHGHDTMGMCCSEMCIQLHRNVAGAGRMQAPMQCTVM